MQFTPGGVGGEVSMPGPNFCVSDLAGLLHGPFLLNFPLHKQLIGKSTEMANRHCESAAATKHRRHS